jgi:hypothetical protein
MMMMMNISDWTQLPGIRVILCKCWWQAEGVISPEHRVALGPKSATAAVSSCKVIAK